MKPIYVALLASTVLAGCASQPTINGEWAIEDIANRGVIDASPATLHFLPEGRLAGNASCNQIMGSYVIKGTSLTIEPAGTTMMACPEALMNQERRLLDMLPTIVRFTIDDTQTLILYAQDGSQIKALRQ